MLHDVNSVWVEALRDLWSDGKSVQPRDIPCYELLGYQTVVDMFQPVLLVPGRKIGYKFMAAEAAWILEGNNRLSDIRPFAKDIVNFSDDGHFFFGAYGPQLVDQLPYMLRALTRDPHTRQAVSTIWRQSPYETKDVPCTVTIQAFIRGEYINLSVYMRSSDIWLGWPYDVFNFSMYARLLRMYLHLITKRKLYMGKLYLTAGSQHLYDHNVEKSEEICKDFDLEGPKPSMLYTPELNNFTLVDWLWTRAHMGDIRDYVKEIK